MADMKTYAVNVPAVKRVTMALNLKDVDTIA